MTWKTIVDDGESLIEVNENGSILRHGSAEHTHHEFYKNCNPQALTSWHRGFLTELIETVRKRRREEE